MDILKFIRSNIGFLIALSVLAAIALVPDLKALVLQGIMKTGLFRPGAGAYTKENVKPPKAPPVLFQSPPGDTVDISQPGTLIFVNFWAPWCPPCIAEMPSIQALKTKLKDKKVKFIMVDVDANLTLSRAFMKKKNFDLPVYISVNPVPETLFDGSLPTTLIIDAQGFVIYRHEGIADYNSTDLERFINLHIK